MLRLYMLGLFMLGLSLVAISSPFFYFQAQPGEWSASRRVKSDVHHKKHQKDGRLFRQQTVRSENTKLLLEFTFAALLSSNLGDCVVEDFVTVHNLNQQS